MGQNYYCKWCGLKFSSVMGLTSGPCSRNPDGKRHQLYEGSEKSQYVCKHCGLKFSTLIGLTAGPCSKNPNGKRHEPAL
jgi:DNA-directed RNA polymerase subunit RPC12/RpoP